MCRPPRAQDRRYVRRAAQTLCLLPCGRHTECACYCLGLPSGLLFAKRVHDVHANRSDGGKEATE